jgi:hypothetical protein
MKNIILWSAMKKVALLFKK